MRASWLSQCPQEDLLFGHINNCTGQTKYPMMLITRNFLVCILLAIETNAFTVPPISLRRNRMIGLYMSQRDGRVQPIDVKYDCYKVLGVSRTADTSEIRKAFANLAMTCHPDVNNEPDAADKFLLINEAYGILSDQDSRQKYDAIQRMRGIDQLEERLTKPMTRAQSLIVLVAGLLAGGPVIVPLTLARFCVEPFASAIPSLSKTCRPKSE